MNDVSAYVSGSLYTTKEKLRFYFVYLLKSNLMSFVTNNENTAVTSK